LVDLFEMYDDGTDLQTLNWHRWSSGQQTTFWNVGMSDT